MLDIFGCKTFQQKTYQLFNVNLKENFVLNGAKYHFYNSSLVHFVFIIFLKLYMLEIIFNELIKIKLLIESDGIFWCYY